MLVIDVGEQAGIEGLARSVRTRAGFGDNDFVLATTLARACLGPDAVFLDPALAGPAYLRLTWTGAHQIAARPDDPDLRFSIAHELGHHAIRNIAGWRLPPVREERFANRFAAALLAPASAVRAAHTAYGEQGLGRIARAFGLSKTATSLRLAEVLGDERAVVTRSGHVLARGDRWDELNVVHIARAPRSSPGIARRRFRGGIDEGRVALRAR